MEKISYSIYDPYDDISHKFNNIVFDIVFIGGGPATLAFISYLFKNGLSESFFNKLNILILEKGVHFGSGCLGKYGINSNTSAEGFVRLICQSSDNSNKNKIALSPDKANPSKKKNDLTPMPIFTELYKSSVTQLLLNIGSKVTPLNLAGEFLQSAGNSYLSFIKKTFQKSIFFGETEVLSIKQHNSPIQYEVSCVRRNTKYIIKSKTIVLASGAKQRFDQKIKNQILNEIPQEAFFNSDYVLQEDGYDKLYKYLATQKAKIERKMSNSSNNKKLKVVIIGGSHSGFSCAWILLNGYSRYSSQKNASKYKPKDNLENNTTTSIKTNFQLSCNCLNYYKDKCMCFGEVKDMNWSSVNKEPLNNLEIVIIYRDHIKVYYSTEREALNDGYNIYDPSKAVNKNSNVYPFIGIRGDAKELYRSIVSGKEKRVSLVKAKGEELYKHVKGSTTVIWAGGYSTNNIPIYESDDATPIHLYCEEGSTCEVTKELYVVNHQKVPIKNMLGIGQGYATFSIEILTNGKKGKADSVNLYSTHIAKKLYKTLEDIYQKNKLVYQSVSKIHDIRPSIIKNDPIVVKQKSKVYDVKIVNDSVKLVGGSISKNNTIGRSDIHAQIVSEKNNFFNSNMNSESYKRDNKEYENGKNIPTKNKQYFNIKEIEETLKSKERQANPLSNSVTNDQLSKIANANQLTPSKNKYLVNNNNDKVNEKYSTINIRNSVNNVNNFRKSVYNNESNKSCKNYNIEESLKENVNNKLLNSENLKMTQSKFKIIKHPDKDSNSQPSKVFAQNSNYYIKCSSGNSKNIAQSQNNSTKKSSVVVNDKFPLLSNNTQTKSLSTDKSLVKQINKHVNNVEQHDYNQLSSNVRTSINANPSDKLTSVDNSRSTYITNKNQLCSEGFISNLNNLNNGFINNIQLKSQITKPDQYPQINKLYSRDNLVNSKAFNNLNTQSQIKNYGDKEKDSGLNYNYSNSPQINNNFKSSSEYNNYNCLNYSNNQQNYRYSEIAVKKTYNYDKNNRYDEKYSTKNIQKAVK